MATLFSLCSALAKVKKLSHTEPVLPKELHKLKLEEFTVTCPACQMGGTMKRKDEAADDRRWIIRGRIFTETCSGF